MAVSKTNQLLRLVYDCHCAVDVSSMARNKQSKMQLGHSSHHAKHFPDGSPDLDFHLHNTNH